MYSFILIEYDNLKQLSKNKILSFEEFFEFIRKCGKATTLRSDFDLDGSYVNKQNS